MEQHSFIIYGKGEVPTFVKSWLMSHGINDFKFQYSSFSFFGTEDQKNQLMSQLYKNETHFKVIGIDNLSDICVTLTAQYSPDAYKYFIHKEFERSNRKEITAQTAFEIYLANNYFNKPPDDFKTFLKNLHAYQKTVCLRKTKFATIINSQIETSWLQS